MKNIDCDLSALNRNRFITASEFISLGAVQRNNNTEQPCMC
ncbi:MAG: hypothetical protein V1802_03430 [Candidatus Aenigmatarchaeota archaeon]